MITVAELMAQRPGEIDLVAGRAGVDRLVTWAHVCDLPDPWAWVRPGDLVMTTGDGLPADPDAQRAWLSALVDVGISGLLLASRPGAPAISTAMCEVADERSTSLLTGDFSLEFVGVARTVIEHAVRSERDHIATARRLFDVYSEAQRTREDFPGRLDAVARSLGWSIRVVRADGALLAAGGVEPAARAAGVDEQGSDAPIVVPVPGRVPAEVRVQPTRRRLLDGALVHYLAGLVGIEIEHLAGVRRERLRRGGLVLRGFLDGAIGAVHLRFELAERGLATGPVVLAHLVGGAGELDGWAPEPGRHAVEPLLVAEGVDVVWALVPPSWSGLDELRGAVAPGARVGLSAPFVPSGDVTDAVLQARLAATEATAGGPVVDYGRLDGRAGLGPRSVTEARRLVDAVLGPLLAHDRENGADLVRSVEVFLRHDGSWTRASAELGIHRQTLVYRLAQVERLTGHKPSSTTGVAALWPALRAADAVQSSEHPAQR